MSEDSSGVRGQERSPAGPPSPLDVLGSAQGTGPDWWSRLREGSQRWGSCEHSYLRYGMWRLRITMYPPGASASDRLRIRVWRGWSMWCVAAWLVGTLVIQWCGVSAGAALVVSIVVAILTGLACRRYVGSLRFQVRTASVLTMAGCTNQTFLDRRDKLVAVAQTMMGADRALNTGVIDAVEHELIWQRMYNEIDSFRDVLAK